MDTASTPSPAPTTAPVSDSSNSAIIFGALGLLLALIGIGIALLQLRQLARRRRTKPEIFELA
jgi:flagellar biogenesis protein FliO